jgi:hypothetical protein
MKAAVLQGGQASSWAKSGGSVGINQLKAEGLGRINSSKGDRRLSRLREEACLLLRAKMVGSPCKTKI